MHNSYKLKIDNIIICTENAYRYGKDFEQIRHIAKTSSSARSQLIHRGIIKLI